MLCARVHLCVCVHARARESLTRACNAVLHAGHAVVAVEALGTLDAGRANRARNFGKFARDTVYSLIPWSSRWALWARQARLAGVAWRAHKTRGATGLLGIRDLVLDAVLPMRGLVNLHLQLPKHLVNALRVATDARTFRRRSRAFGRAVDPASRHGCRRRRRRRRRRCAHWTIVDGIKDGLQAIELLPHKLVLSHVLVAL